MSLFSFAILAPLVLVSALAVILWTNPIASALSLIVTLSSLAIVYFELNAPVVGILQILLYSGAIMVLFIFVIMLINLKPDEMEALRWSVKTVGMIAVGLLVALGLGAVIWQATPLWPAALPATFGSVTAIGETLLTSYALAFELISFVILTAIVGATVLARRSSSEDIR